MPRWIQRCAVVGLVLIFLGVAGGAIVWTWGPRYSFQRSCHLCGRAQQCGKRLGLRWEGEIRSTPTSDWIGDRVLEHEHMWLAKRASFEMTWWERPIIPNITFEVRTVPEAIIGDGAKSGGTHSLALLEEYIADVRSRGASALADWCERYQTGIDPWTEFDPGY